MANLNFDIEDAKIMYRNFSGAQSKYNPAGKRNFHVVLDEDVAAQLSNDGWNVKKKEYEDGDVVYSLKVNVIMNERTKVYLITDTGKRKKKTPLTADTIGSLDYAEIISCDMSIRGWVYDEDTGDISAYLKVGYFNVASDKFSSKYDFDEDEECPFD